MFQKIWNAVCCGLFAAVCLTVPVYFMLFHTPRAESVTENRTLAQFSRPTLTALTSGEFQRNFENAFSDQVFFRDGALMLNTGKQKIISALPNRLFRQQVSRGEVLEVFEENALYELSGERYLLQLPFIYDEEVASAIEHAGEAYGILRDALPEANIIVYDIEPVFLSSASPLNDLYPGSVSGAYSRLFAESIPDGIVSVSKRYTDIETILHEFYRTDHHFNAYGAADVYTTIYNELSKLTYIGEPVDVSDICEVPHSEMMGSKARVSLYDGLSEPLTDINCTLPEYTVYMNGEEKARSRAAQVVTGEVRQNADASEEDTRFLSMYAMYFGYDHAEILYENHESESGRTLLLVGPSYTQTFEKILASHYDKTYVVDPRYFPEEQGYEFDAVSYAQKIGADDIVYFAQSRTLASDAWVVKGGDAGGI